MTKFKPGEIILSREKLRAAFREACPEAWGEGGGDTLEDALFGPEAERE